MQQFRQPLYQSPRRPSIWKRLLSWCRRHPIWTAIIIIAFIVIGSVSNATSQSPVIQASPTPTATIAQATFAPTDTPTPLPTAKPTVKPTAKPTPKPTARPTPVIVSHPTPTPIPQLAISFTCADAGDVCVHTLAGASLTIKVLYCSGYYATSKSLQGTFSADSGGNYEWFWMVETSCHGQATAYVNASLNGKTVSGQAHFTT